MTSADVDLIIPARNEAANMAALFNALDGLGSNTFRRIIVCDNGSSDETAKLAADRGAVVLSKDQPGYGAACLGALDWIGHDSQPMPRAVAFFDADLADDPTYLRTLIAMVVDDEADLAMGARHALAQPGALDPHQRFGNWLSGMLIGLATGRFYRDMGPMRVIRFSSLAQLNMGDRTWGWTVEMQYKAALAGLRVKEMDVPYRRRHAGRSKISGTLIGSAKAGFTILTTICGLWWRTNPATLRRSSEQPVAVD